MASIDLIERDDPFAPAPPPTQDELPYDDGVPMESERHRLQMNLLIETLQLHWSERTTGYAGGNMFVYFNLSQAKNQEFRGPDFFAVVDAVKKERKSWVVWEEKLGPDVIIELLSESTEAVDRGQKKRVYQDRLRVPEYFWYDPFSGELAGFRLMGGRYTPIQMDQNGRLHSDKLDLLLVRKEGTYQSVQAPWLRWMTEDGQILPTQQEHAEQEHQRAEQEHQRAEQERQRAEQEHQRAEQERQRAEQAEERLRRLEEELQRLRAGHEG